MANLHFSNAYRAVLSASKDVELWNTDGMVTTATITIFAIIQYCVFLKMLVV